MGITKQKQILEFYNSDCEFEVNGKKLKFKRQSMKDVYLLKERDNDDLMEEYKGLHFVNFIAQCGSLNDMQRQDLIGCELSIRMDTYEEENDTVRMDLWNKQKDEFDAWCVRAEKDMLAMIEIQGSDGIFDAVNIKTQ